MTLLNRRPLGISTLGSLARGVLLLAAAVTATSYGLTVAADEKPTTRAGEPASAFATTALDEPELSSPPYDARGKRDPFLSPVGQMEQAQPVGLDVDSLELQGIVETPRGFTAMLKGPDQRTHFVRPGEQFFNGRLVAIDAASLTFEVQSQNLFGARVTRNVVVPLHPEQDGGQSETR